MHYDLYESRARGCYTEMTGFRAVTVVEEAVVTAELRPVPFLVFRVLLFAFDRQLWIIQIAYVSAH
jgi:hypothetical protein